MTDLRKAAKQALEALESAQNGMNECYKETGFDFANEQYEVEQAIEAIRARSEKPPVKTYCGGKPNYCTPVDVVPKFREPKVRLSRMKPGDRFILVRTGAIYRIQKDGSQWNETRQRPGRLHKNSHVQLIVTHPKCDDACMNICTEGFTKPPTCNTPVDAVNMTQEPVDETAKREHD